MRKDDDDEEKEEARKRNSVQAPVLLSGRGRGSRVLERPPQLLVMSTGDADAQPEERPPPLPPRHSTSAPTSDQPPARRAEARDGPLEVTDEDREYARLMQQRLAEARRSQHGSAILHLGSDGALEEEQWERQRQHQRDAEEARQRRLEERGLTLDKMLQQPAAAWDKDAHSSSSSSAAEHKDGDDDDSSRQQKRLTRRQQERAARLAAAQKRATAVELHVPDLAELERKRQAEQEAKQRAAQDAAARRAKQAARQPPPHIEEQRKKRLPAVPPPKSADP